MTLLSFHFKN